MRIFLLTVFGALIAIGQTSAPWRILPQLAQQRENADDFRGAEALFKEAIQSAEHSFGPDDPILVTLLAELAATLHHEAHDAEAEPMLHRATTIANATGDPHYMGIALNALGIALSGEGERARAEPVLRRSLALLEQASGTDSLDAAKAMNNLATLYANTQQYAKAEEQMTRALALYEKHLGSSHPLIAVTLGNMFVILFDQHRAAEAEPYLRRAISIGERTFPQSERMANLRFSEAALEAGRGNFQAAASLLEGVIAIQERCLGPQHPRVARSLVNYSEVLRRLHQKDDAKQALHRANSILKSLHE